MSKTISIVTPCFNEGENIEELCQRIKSVMENIQYEYEHICIDNCSTDNTVSKLKEIAKKDKHIKLIVNSRNFGGIRSPYHALLESNGDASVLLAADLQDPPEMIEEFVQKWEQGFKTVLAVKPESEESPVMFFLRRIYYKFITRISDVPLVQNSTGAGLFDRDVINILRSLNDPYPYFRGLVCDVGCPIATIPFRQPRRKRGVTSTNFYSLYDYAMLGITNHSKIPLRVMTMGGFMLSLASLVIAVCFLVAKLVYWDSFQLGMAPIVIGMFFIGAVQLFFLGILGEYIGAIHTQVQRRPLVIEKERLNFD